MTPLHGICESLLSAAFSENDGGRLSAGTCEQMRRLADLSDCFDEDAGPAPDQVALPGHDGERAEQLLDASKRQGVRLLTDLARPAVRRLLRGASRGENLFNGSEIEALADQLAATTSSADLLGRSRVRLRLQRIHRFDEATDFSCFDESLAPMPPSEALSYFRRLVPTLGVRPRRFGQLHERRAFTMAEATGIGMLRRVKRIIERALETGDVGSGPAEIDRVLSAAGLHPSNPQYGEMVFRTNMMEAFRAGAQRAFSDPDVADAFPVWRYIGIQDGRERPAHRKHFEKFFDRSVPFVKVRGVRIGDAANCRCDMQPIYKDDWRSLRRKGAALTAA
jgi:hypothetical protein